MIEHDGQQLTVSRPGGRRIVIQALTPQDGVTALQAMGYGAETAQVFAYSGGDRAKVIELGQRKHLITKGK